MSSVSNVSKASKMSAEELLKLRLLSHSQNMINAAQKSDWEKLQALDHQWVKLIEGEFAEAQSKIQSIVPQLLMDNDKLQSIVLAAQQEILQSRQTEMKALSSIRNYLK